MVKRILSLIYFRLYDLFSMLKIYRINTKVTKESENNQKDYKDIRGYLAVSFDDFRLSDFTWVIPMLRQYGFSGTFNYIIKEKPSLSDRYKVKICHKYGMEVGDHTIFHLKYPYCSPLFNGQHSNDEGQIPFPTNDEMRCDRGDGKNFFARDLDAKPVFQASGCHIDTSWRLLSDQECELIRQQFSVYGSQFCETLDRMSNCFLGTSGKSKGSWDGEKYTGGIFTGCKTSENHEVWERIIEIEKKWFEYYFPGIPFFTNWSLPGSEDANLYFENDGIKYYDREMKSPANDSAKFISSITGENRSWSDVLWKYGYRTKSDSWFKGRVDGLESVYPKWFIAKDLILDEKSFECCSIGSVVFRWPNPCKGYEMYYGNEDIVEKLYMVRGGDNDDYYQTIEKLRFETSRGIICGSIWDSQDKENEKTYWKAILEYCKNNGIQVVSNRQAYDLMNKEYTFSNYFINHDFRCSCPTNDTKKIVDGFSGDAYSVEDDSCNVLHICGKADYRTYGISNGAFNVVIVGKGSGSIQIDDGNNVSMIRIDSTNDSEYDSLISVDTSLGYLDYEFDGYMLIQSIVCKKVSLSKGNRRVEGI